MAARRFSQHPEYPTTSSETRTKKLIGKQNLSRQSNCDWVCSLTDIEVATLSRSILHSTFSRPDAEHSARIATARRIARNPSSLIGK
jgi:hypothetical protein